MANCKMFQDLSPQEKIEFFGKLLHAVQSDSNLFSAGQEIIEIAEIKGLFDGVTINPVSEAEILN